jgi:hypothetical protein
MNGCLPQSVRIFLLAALVGIANAFSAPAHEIPSRAVNPATYKSPSGADTLTVDPSHCYGRYDGAYRVAKSGKELWAKSLPFTLCNATRRNGTGSILKG